MYIRKYNEVTLTNGMCTPCKASGCITKATKMICIGNDVGEKEDFPLNVCDSCNALSVDEIVRAVVIVLYGKQEVAA